jgi:hypothetical protein
VPRSPTARITPQPRTICVGSHVVPVPPRRHVGSVRFPENKFNNFVIS